MISRNSLTVPDSNRSRFDLDKAIELLNLVDEAHQLFDITNKGWNEWIDNDTALPSSQQKPYSAKVDWNNDYDLLKHLIDKRNRNWELVGFIAKHKKEVNNIYVVFRGTLVLDEWINNFRIVQNDAPKDREVEIHKGFLETCIKGEESIQKQINQTLTPIISSTNNLNFYVTGHSRGGALATVTLHLMQNDFDLKSHTTQLYTFASPRVGDSDFAQKFDFQNCFRIANSEDLIPKLPLATLTLFSLAKIPFSQLLFQKNIPDGHNYEHVGQSIYFTYQKGDIPDNHTIPVYKETLDITKKHI